MARTVRYVFKKQQKDIPFSYGQYRTIHEAVAAAEGIDLTEFLKMELQVGMVATDSKAVKEYRDSYFKKLGFGKIAFLREESQSIKDNRN